LASAWLSVLMFGMRIPHSGELPILVFGSKSGDTRLDWWPPVDWKTHMLARIYRPAKTAMQSGGARADRWVLEFEAEVAGSIDPLMGYTSSGDMNSQVVMCFDAKEQAVAFAEKHGLAYQISEPKKAIRSIRAYSDNFKFGRIGQWTH